MRSVVTIAIPLAPVAHRRTDVNGISTFYREAGPQAESEEGLVLLPWLPGADVHIFDGGHRLLDTHLGEVVPLVRDFLARVYP